ncbi:helicase-related protein [Methanoplanus endosymbiosus]|uniref:SNF2-related protein n=1 Tax=Methanoplanus endosymbiosus TaxID=33865 RepID=A0A9E7PQI1_9EURY|nr:helicase-related protein [Methanoplanus endosymbiosus]UUX92976.1 SNF2-related protein [Methanoplanus endosymbiosus]
MVGSISSPEQIIEIVNDALQVRENSTVNILNDKLTLTVFSELEKNLKNVREINFIIRGTNSGPKNKEMVQEFELAASPSDVLFNNYEIVKKNKLKYFHKARAMHDFIESHVNVKKVKSPEMVKGNILIIDEDIQIQGTSSLEITKSKKIKGLPQINFDTFINSSMDTDQIKRSVQSFYTLWNNRGYTSEYKEELLEGLRYIYKDYSPEFLYYFTLYSLFGDQLDSSVEHFENDSTRFKQTKIWNTLYNFQKDAVVSGIQKINKHNGCIIADSVGLGKTFEALAIIKYFEMRNDNVLVLAPAKLYDNWDSFRSPYKDNPLAGDRLNYKILSHTDLSRNKGFSRSGLDLSRIDWGSFDLLVIDESHNFRNRIESEDHVTRYQKLLRDIIHKGANTKVLLLSATPVNNSLTDLRNQISIITSDRDYAFEEDGISSVQHLLIRAQKDINEWSKTSRRNKTELLDRLPSEFYKLLEMVTISRSRKHITRYYGTENIGVFPKKLTPMIFRPEIDSESEIMQFADVNEELEGLLLCVYSPMAYILPKYKEMYRERFATKINGKRIFDHEQREAINVKLNRFNLCKRLESSVYSFGKTVERLLGRIDSHISRMSSGTGTVSDEYDLEDEEEFFLEYKYDIDVRHLDVRNYLEDLRSDKEKLERISGQVRIILDEKRDFKLHEITAFVRNKINETPYNPGNQKVLIFTAFADTANYLYDSLWPILKEEGVHTAIVTGTGSPKTTIKGANLKYNEVLARFSPRSKGRSGDTDTEIEVLVATDCISEGQNLQDCDCVINFDIQWNPVVLIQRFGRIDRLGSINPQIQMVNFFPHMDLNDYLQLEERVKRKMVAANIGSTGDEDLLTPDLNDLEFRRTQLERIQEEVVELEEMGDTISLTDLNMNGYLNELYEYVKENPDVKKVPAGVFSITKGEEKGCLFCFRHSEDLAKPKSDSSLYPYYLMYVQNSGEVYIGMHNAREALAEFRRISYGKSEPDDVLIRNFNKKTHNAEDMTRYSKLITKAISGITGAERKRAEESIFDFSGFSDEFSDSGEDDFELISFLIVE